MSKIKAHLRVFLYAAIFGLLAFAVVRGLIWLTALVMA